MTRTALTIVTGLATLAVAGCGGGSDSNKTLSYSDFSKKADAICADITTKIDAAGSPTGDPANDAPILAKIVPLTKDGSARLKKLNPPKELQADFDKFTSLTDQQTAQAEKAEAAAKAGDKAGYIAVLKATQPLGQQTNAEGSKLGAAACAK